MREALPAGVTAVVPLQPLRPPDVAPRAGRAALEGHEPVSVAYGPPGPPAPPDRRPADPPGVVAATLATSALRILASLLLAFVAHVAVLGGLTFDRDQAVLYDQARESLARGEAALGQTDIDGQLVRTGAPVGLLEVASIGLRQVVVEGTTSQVLTSAPGHRRDTVLPGQPGVSIVMGRQAGFGGAFGRLGEVLVGDEIVVTTGQGRHVYEVLAVRGAGDPAPAPLPPGAGRLTLMTADGWAFLPRDVLRVDATLVSTPVAAPPRVVTAAQLSPAEQPMQADTAALVPLLLWSQLLLAAVVATTWSRVRWGRWQTWVVSVPVLTGLFLEVADQAARLLPNLL